MASIIVYLRSLPPIRNASAATKPAFRDPLTSRRCLIPADGFYEWQRNGKAKQPYCFEVNDGELFAFAGRWDRWERSERTVGQVLFDLDDNAESALLTPRLA